MTSTSFTCLALLLHIVTSTIRDESADDINFLDNDVMDSLIEVSGLLLKKGEIVIAICRFSLVILYDNIILTGVEYK